MVVLQHFKVILVLLDVDESRLLLGDDHKEETDEQTEDQVHEGEVSLFGEMLEKDEGDIEDVVGEVENEQEVEGKGDLSDLAVRSLHVEQFLDSLLVHDHLSDVLILVLYGQIQRQFPNVVLDVSVAAAHQQLLDYSSVAGHHC